MFFLFIKVFPWIVDRMQEGTPCHYIVIITDIAHPFLITAFPSP